MKSNKEHASDIDDDSDNERSYIEDYDDAMSNCVSRLATGISFFFVNFVKMTLMTLLGSLFYLPQVFHSYHHLKMFIFVAQFVFTPGVLMTYIDIVTFMSNPTRTEGHQQLPGMLMLSIILYMLYCAFSLTFRKHGWVHIGTIYIATLLSLKLFAYVISHNEYVADNMRLYYESGSTLFDTGLGLSDGGTCSANTYDAYNGTYNGTYNETDN
jgi:hypothetical protein